MKPTYPSEAENRMLGRVAHQTSDFDARTTPLGFRSDFQIMVVNREFLRSAVVAKPALQEGLPRLENK